MSTAQPIGPQKLPGSIWLPATSGVSGHFEQQFAGANRMDGVWNMRTGELAVTQNSANFNVVPIPRSEGGKFAKGSPGRPVGSRNKLGKQFLEQIKSMGPDAIQKLYEAVLSGEKWSIELVISYILPKERTVELEEFTIEDVQAAIKEGDVSPTEGKELLAVLEKIANITEIEELRERLEKLERLAGEK
jgi:hypothetical protein